MGAYYYMRHATRADIAQLKEEPGATFDFMNRENRGERGDSRDTVELRERSFLRRLLLRDRPRKVAVSWSPPEDGDEECLEWSYEALHFLLTGTNGEGEPPACYLMRDAYLLRDGSGPSGWILEPEQVSQFADYLESLTRDELRARYDPTRMDALEIHPKNWVESGAAGFDLLFQYFGSLRAFVGSARDLGHGIVSCIT